MSVKSKFCITISDLQEMEMKNFIESVEGQDYDRASRTLESLGAMYELGLDICEVDNRRKRRY